MSLSYLLLILCLRHTLNPILGQYSPTSEQKHELIGREFLANLKFEGLLEVIKKKRWCG
jgi:hypothetical protein